MSGPVGTQGGAGLWRLVYWSRNLIVSDAAGSGAEEDLNRILGSARRNNPSYGVTGALLFNRGAFAQVLEGPREGIIEIFERIQCDPRHADMVVLDYAAVPERCFAEWSMGFLGTEAAEDYVPLEFADGGRGLAERLSSDRSLSAIRAMLQEARSL
jgi:hypothetical protein